MDINFLKIRRHCLQSRYDVVENMKRIYITNKKKSTLGSAYFTKVDASNQSIKLRGAVFNLYMLKERKCCYEECLLGLVTKDDGTLTINQLAVGKYMLAECKAPNGYMLEDTKVFFCIKQDEAGEAIDTKNIMILNNPKSKECCCERCYCDC